MFPMKHAIAAACVVLTFSASSSLARDVESLQPLLFEAIEHGRAEGVLVGPIAQTFTDLFKTSTPLRFSVTTVGDVSPGCKRLEVKASQDAVWDRNSKTVATGPEPRRLTYRVSMCKDGSYPRPAR